MQMWIFSKHHIFKYDFWEKTQYSNMNFWCFLFTPEHVVTLVTYPNNGVWFWQWVAKVV